MLPGGVDNGVNLARGLVDGNSTVCSVHARPEGAETREPRGVKDQLVDIGNGQVNVADAAVVRRHHSEHIAVAEPVQEHEVGWCRQRNLRCYAALA